MTRQMATRLDYRQLHGNLCEATAQSIQSKLQDAKCERPAWTENDHLADSLHVIMSDCYLTLPLWYSCTYSEVHPATEAHLLTS